MQTFTEQEPLPARHHVTNQICGSAGQSCSFRSHPGAAEMELAGGMRLARWCKLVGISRRTAHRYRKSGRLKVIVRYGQAYVTPQTIADFFVDDGSETRRPSCQGSARAANK